MITGPHDQLPLLIRVSGRDRPSLTRDLLAIVGRAGAVLEDMEQLVVRERLTLDVLVRLDGASDGVIRDILYFGFTHDLKVDFERVEARSSRSMLVQHSVARCAPRPWRQWRTPLPRPVATSTASSDWPPSR